MDVTDDPLGHRSQQPALQKGLAAMPDHNQVHSILLRVIDDLFVWMAHGDFKSVIGYAPFSTPYSAGIST